MNNNKIGICGHFGGDEVFLDGQTVKTKIITNELIEKYGNQKISTVDTYGGIKNLFDHITNFIKLIRKCNNIIILPAQHSLPIFSIILCMLNSKRGNKVHYVVIGGWLPKYLKKRPLLKKMVKKFDYIYVETETMKEKLDLLGLENIVILPNTKQLNIIDNEAIVTEYTEPYNLCTFSRITKQKGIETAIEAVEYINSKYGKEVYTLTNYGQIDPLYKQRFSELMSTVPPYIKYGGMVNYEDTTDTLKNYFALIFPTEFYTEGLPGTVLDAYSAGLPVISSRWESFNDIIDENITGIGYTFNNKKELIKLLDIIYTKPSIIINMKVNCVNKSKEYLPQEALKPLIRRLDDVDL